MPKPLSLFGYLHVVGDERFSDAGMSTSPHNDGN